VRRWASSSGENGTEMYSESQLREIIIYSNIGQKIARHEMNAIKYLFEFFTNFSKE
jgi:hypothetical protein